MANLPLSLHALGSSESVGKPTLTRRLSEAVLHAKTGDMPDHRPTGLDDPDYARFAWARFRLLMAWMTLAAAICIAGVIVALANAFGPLHIATMLGVIGGVGGSVMLAGALMGLVFLSSGTGHDEDVERID